MSTNISLHDALSIKIEHCDLQVEGVTVYTTDITIDNSNGEYTLITVFSDDPITISQES